jgi:hypothetical protein
MYNLTLMHPVCSSFSLFGGLLRCFSAVVQAPGILMGGMFAFASFYYLGSNNIHICVCEVKALFFFSGGFCLCLQQYSIYFGYHIAIF